MKDHEHPNTYMVQDLRDGRELQRLSIQDAMLTANMGGVLPEQSEASIARLRMVLDVGCGTGGWLRDLARVYPHIEKLVGVDISNRTIRYAKQQAEEQGLANRMFFFVMDALQMLQFPDATFDLINLRLGVSFMRTWDWHKLLQGFNHVARPGGIIRLIDGEMGFQECSSRALTLIYTLMQRAFEHSGHFFTPGYDGLTAHLPDLLEKQGYVAIQKQTFLVNYAGTSSEAEAYRKDIELSLSTIRPFLTKWGAMIPNYDAICQQALEDMQQPDFRGVGNLVVVWGQKEGAEPFEKMTVGYPPITTVPSKQEKFAFTERELQIAILVAQGFQNKQIAAQLDISVKTVNAHLSSIYAKMNYEKGSARMHITRYVLEKQLIDPRET